MRLGIRASLPPPGGQSSLAWPACSQVLQPNTHPHPKTIGAGCGRAIGPGCHARQTEQRANAGMNPRGIMRAYGSPPPQRFEAEGGRHSLCCFLRGAIEQLCRHGCCTRSEPQTFKEDTHAGTIPGSGNYRTCGVEVP